MKYYYKKLLILKNINYSFDFFQLFIISIYLKIYTYISINLLIF